ncbi:beta-ketoacyl synthase [Rodentibacter caecimuris]|uniref:Beta-ketoacyl synthase n=1 Tax=Rodentibacter caecimuris TaxID=1796644 RepID=A0AAJ3K3J3_9PAST|nr:beta-ketoacyl synthase N-terminal-like domain-containing protein [Rodentibacter heylii]AOF52962.1 3-oxoacyl-[acyl-carrier-protein] synthase, KASII [Pasteurellaceae bacterium NI1060]MCX2961325.1 beta-ketoacyl synthase [Rodentibacter heylii]OOF71439.1 beta-ketoacyl synthase [Rodentibacter heylii]OOF76201.1 beta-ketoacyl synthase [Rodentibacter heylii]OOF77110.1 beta-ketoacyl synthase [Rodentibacter heylii]
MTVYINAVSAQFAEKLGQRTSQMLGQTTVLPYFNAFKEPLLSLERLYAYFDEQIDGTLKQVNWNKTEVKNIPILLGSTAYVMSDCEARIANQQPLPKEYSLAVIADHLRERYQTQVFSFATSCTSSAQAIGYAYKMLKNNIAEKALVLGFEMFNRLTFEHFQAMNLLSQEPSYLPMIASNGMILGEGMGCIALSIQPNRSLYCEILGVTSVTDNENLTNSNKNSLKTLLKQCLKKAQISAEQIQGIKIHGVGGSSDEMEKQVLRELFPQTEWMLVKPYMGHTLGASGVLETVFFYQSLQAKYLAELPWQMQIESKSQSLTHGKALKCGYYLHYFLGFGGSHIAWVTKVGG